MKTNSVSFSSGDCGIFLRAQFDESGAVDEGVAGLTEVPAESGRLRAVDLERRLGIWLLSAEGQNFFVGGQKFGT